MAKTILRRRMFVLLALVALSVVAGKCGFPGFGPAHGGFGMWDGPI